MFYLTVCIESLLTIYSHSGAKDSQIARNWLVKMVEKNAVNIMSIPLKYLHKKAHIFSTLFNIISKMLFLTYN